jgi:phosphoglycerate dehydrogenase-like enzyme
VLLDAPLPPAAAKRIRKLFPRIRLIEPGDERRMRDAQVLFTSACEIGPDRLPNLRFIQINSVAVDCFDSPLIRSGVPVCNASGAFTPAVAEFSVAMLLALRRKLPQCLELQRRREFPTGDDVNPLAGRNCWGTTLGLVGYGSIARHVARIARAMGMRVLACKRNIHHRADPKFRPHDTGDPRGVIPDEWFEITRLRQMLRRCDSVVVSLPRTRETMGTVGAKELAALPPHAVLVNVGRGGVVDEDALARALRAGRLAAAGLDVFCQEPLPPDSPLWDVPNLLAAPHIAALTVDHADLVADVLHENLRRHLAGKPLVNVVDMDDGY